MKPLTKITLILILIVCGIAFARFVFFSEPAEELGHTHAILPAGSPNTTYTEGGLVPTTVGYKTEEVRPFDTLLEKTPRPSLQTVLENVYLNVYQIMPCTYEGEQTNVISFTKRPDPTPEVTGYANADAAFAAWEPYVYEDLGKFMFPERSTFTSEPLVFNYLESAEVHRAKISNQDEYIYKGERVNFVFYASSLDCLEGGMDLVYDLH